MSTSKTLPNRRKFPKSKPASESETSKKLILRARAVMGDRGVRSVSSLQRSLGAIGVAISLPQLIRVVDGSAKHINKDVIEGMLTVLNCGVSDLFAVV
jgi:Cro/C1-type HTH DNA-binding domain